MKTYKECLQHIQGRDARIESVDITCLDKDDKHIEYRYNLKVQSGGVTFYFGAKVSTMTNDDAFHEFVCSIDVTEKE